MLPQAVMEIARDELLDYRGSGMSVMEFSHRSAAFDEIADRTEASLRQLLGVPEDYAILFLAGGATQQFSLLPMNLATRARPGGYLVNGHWGRKALASARLLGLGELVASSENTGFRSIPAEDSWTVPAHCTYLHLTSNETIGGVQFHRWPDVATTLVADMSSDLLSRPLDVSRFGVLYASAQKNLGQAGITVVVVRRDLLTGQRAGLPDIFSWRQQDQQGSRLNTPPCFAWYMAGLVFEWIKEQGGLQEMQQRNGRKAGRLYGAIDRSDFYINDVDKAARSLMNVPFRIRDESLHTAFVRMAENSGLTGLKGHKVLGGMRASIYNAMPETGVDALVAVMAEFERRFG
jgi:phosphoserine aminotransferase